ncbi:hypothetical protein BB561_000631 [Smittium simulii]|uniref:VPS37 C-terminal domain-containing protein n=1 Tax=Smittium simulii TaxID=133385 RepID=A0A2T9YYC8_9FUNG|nr:hypothetical protein BB561_000631 [Smittium simulii]
MEQQSTSGLPEPMNNYNLPTIEEINQKLQILQDYYPTFANKGVEDLEDLLKYNDLFQSHFSGIEQVQMTRTLQYELRQQGLALANENLAKKAALEETRRKVEEKTIILNSLTTDFYENSSYLLELQKKYSKKQQTENLAKKVAGLENDTETLVDTFIESSELDTPKTDAQVDAFLREFVTCRTKYHLLAAKSEILHHN